MFLLPELKEVGGKKKEKKVDQIFITLPAVIVWVFLSAVHPDLQSVLIQMT